MCGIFGIIGNNINESDKEIFEYGLTLTGATRGRHSTGVTRVHSDGKADTTKGVGMYSNLIHEDTDGKFFDDVYSVIGDDLVALLGHGRHATVGKINKENAHPFEFDNIIGFHNGTFLEYEVKRFSPDYKKDQTTDTYELFKYIDSLDGDILEASKKFSGALACVVYNKKDGTFNLWRNKDRPMAYVVSKDNKKVIYCSEIWTAWEAVRRYGDSSEWSFKSQAVDHEVKVDTLYKLSVAEDSLTVKETPVVFFKSSGSTTYYGAWSDTSKKTKAKGTTAITTYGSSGSFKDKASKDYAQNNRASFFGDLSKTIKHFQLPEIVSNSFSYKMSDTLLKEYSGMFVYHDTFKNFMWFDGEFLFPGLSFYSEVYPDINELLNDLKPVGSSMSMFPTCGVTYKVGFVPRHPHSFVAERLANFYVDDDNMKFKNNWVYCYYSVQDSRYYIPLRATKTNDRRDKDRPVSFYFDENNKSFMNTIVQHKTDVSKFFLYRPPTQLMAKENLIISDFVTVPQLDTEFFHKRESAA